MGYRSSKERQISDVADISAPRRKHRKVRIFIMSA